MLVRCHAEEAGKEQGEVGGGVKGNLSRVHYNGGMGGLKRERKGKKMPLRGVIR
jgi:hypothetical protein